MGCGFCEAALSNSLGTLIVDCVVEPIGRQLDYVRRFHDNAKKLTEKKDELVDASDRLQHVIEDAKGRLLRIEGDVQNLQSEASKALSDMATLEEEIQLNKRCLNWCPNWCWRYQLSKKAMKKSQDISKLLDKFGRLGPVAYRDPTALPTVDFLCSKEFVFSKSSKAAFNQIIEALKDENINMIGLWGMGGVGKTTLAYEVGSQAQKLNLVDKVVITTVSQKPNFERIQDQIARYIGFDMKNEQGRRSAQELWLRLKKEQRILIILDDIWEHINLKEKIGIPIGGDHKGCKVLLTTRRKRVCQTMKCRPVVQLDCLDNDEAWTLFEKKAGLEDFSDDSIKNLAKEIVKKCGGLPIAIVPLGSAMIDQKSYHEWQAVDQRLRERTLTEIEDIGENNAYVCLEASFDYLKDIVTKTCFLLCSFFPEDYEIYVEDLVGYAWGLELRKCIDPIRDFRSKVLASIEILKNSALLLDSGERHVKMHDVVRQFALWIGSSRNDFPFGTVETLPMDVSFKHYTAISFETDQTDELPKGVVFPNLKLLLLGKSMETSSEFFEGMRALQVCALNYKSISLAAFQFHTNLRTLHLVRCNLSDISMLGKLKTLHILSLDGSGITELPTEVGDLEDLRLLDLSNCRDLRRIAANLIRRLSNLEELYLRGCSSLKWANENSTERESYSSLSELNLLPKLVVISLDISSKALPDGFVFRRLWRFDVCIGIEEGMVNLERDLETCPISRSLRIDESVDACKQLFEDVESLQLQRVGHQNLVPSLDLGFSKLTSLDLHSCDSMQCLIDASKQQVPTTALSNLRKLSLNNLPELEQLCKGPQPQGFLQKLEEFKLKGSRMRVLFPITELESIEQEGSSRHLSLQSLKIVKMESCGVLQYIFPMSVANSLGQLHTLKIKDCRSLEGIIQDSQVPYASLQSLREIIQNPQVSNISFQCLRKVQVTECNNLKYLFPTCVANSLGHLQTLKIERCFGLEEIIQNPQVSNISFQYLLFVEVTECNNLKYLFPTCVANSLGHLGSLKIERCFGLEEIIQNPQVSNISFQELREVEVTECNNLKYLFPTCVANSLGHLGSLKIERCFGLEEIIQNPQVSNISFQELREVEVTECNNLKYLFPTCVANSLGHLRSLKIERCFGLEEIIQNPQVSNISFQELRVVEVTECNNLKYLFPTCVANSLGHLGSLKIERCFGLEEIIQNPQVSNISFQELREVEVTECNNLKYLFPTCVANSLGHLGSLKIERCFGLEEIIQDSQVSNISFQGLWKVEVTECNNLKYLFPTCVANSLGHLRSLKIERCFGLEEIIQNPQVSNISFQKLGFVQVTECNNLKFLFPMSIANSLGQLHTLKIKDCRSLEGIIQDSQVPYASLQSLREIEVEECNNLRFLFPLSIANSLGQLHTLKIKDCRSLEGIIQDSQVPYASLQSLREIEVEECNNLRFLFPMSIANSLGQLHTLKIKDCRSLEGIIQDSQVPYASLQSLREIEVEECNNLRFLFPMSIANSLGQLHTLKIKDCKQMENIIQATQVSNICLLQSLREVSLIDLPQLKGKDVNDMLRLSSLQKLNVHNCPQLTLFIISTTIQELVFGKMTYEQLSNLHLCKYEELKQDQTSSQSHLLPICFSNLTLIGILECENLKSLFPIIFAQGGPKNLNAPNLRTLKIKRCFDMEEIIQNPQVSNISFQCLRKVEVIECINLKYLFPTCVATSLRQLETLKIEKCFGLEEIIQNPQVSNISFQGLGFVQVTECNNLKYLFPTCVANSLGHLHGLKINRCFGLEEIVQNPPVSNTSFQDLGFVQVTECNNLKYLFPTCVASSLGHLQILIIERCFGLEEIIQNPQVSNKSFQCLRKVEVTECNNLKYLFPTCVANSLGHLQTLKIERCFGLEEIIQNPQVSNISFQELREVEVTECNNLKYLFPTCVASSLGHLQILIIERCFGLEEIFQGPEVLISMAQGLARLDKVELINLPQLKGWDRNDIVLTSPYLRELKVEDCPQLIDSTNKQVSQSVDEIIVEESATAQETALPIGSRQRFTKKEDESGFED